MVSMGSAVLNKPPSPFITFVYCFLLISFVFYIPHRIVALGEGSGKSRVRGSQQQHAPSAVQQGSPKQSSPTQPYPKNFVEKALNPNKPVVNCGRGENYKCLPGYPGKREGVTPGERH
ncbi:hypothetical protein Ddye_025408 [Dipteronia dyeriana]|uniref:Uncharacterized protein n=1 Tax=Dipteronia dyeriana TaxID=168575 RepID=A0AAD9TL49_9ROSI|nr:hypothetical protein Ddye_025408 [Dipteronia dyeriana]